MKKVVSSALLAGAVALSSGCASILNDDFQQVNVATSNGKSIEVTVDGNTYQAPGVVNVAREDASKILMTNAAGCTKETVMPKEVSSMFWVNILSGGSFGSTTDYSTEKMWGYQNTVTITCAN